MVIIAREFLQTWPCLLAKDNTIVDYPCRNVSNPLQRYKVHTLCTLGTAVVHKCGFIFG